MPLQYCELRYFVSPNTSSSETSKSTTSLATSKDLPRHSAKKTMSDSNKPMNKPSGDGGSSSGSRFPSWGELKSKMAQFRNKAPWPVVAGTVVGTCVLYAVLKTSFGGPSLVVNVQVFPSSVELNKNSGK